MAAEFLLVVPNQCHNTHDCDIGAATLAVRVVPLITSGPDYRAGRTALVVTWDEGKGGYGVSAAAMIADRTCHLATVVTSPSTPPGTRSSTRFDHYSLLETTERLARDPDLPGSRRRPADHEHARRLPVLRVLRAIAAAPDVLPASLANLLRELPGMGDVATRHRNPARRPDPEVSMSTVGSAVRETGISLATVFRQPALRRLNLALAGSMIGDWAYATAIAVWAYGIGGASAVGIWGTTRLALMAVLAPFASAMADKYPRRSVMIACDLARFVLVAAAAIVVQADGPAAIVFVLASLSPIFGTAFRPAQLALTPSLVKTPEELTAANGVASTVESLAFFVGPAIAAFLLAFTDVAAVFAVNALTFVLSAVLVSGIRQAKTADAPVPVNPAGQAVGTNGAEPAGRGEEGELRRRRPRGLPGDLAPPRPASGGADVLRADGRRRRVDRLHRGHRL